jgi:HAD superfamily hydrolase (TIGR01662 family)
MMTSPDVIMCHGFPGSGKSTYVKTHYTKGCRFREISQNEAGSGTLPCVGTTNTYKEATIISNDLSKNALEDFEKALQENTLIVIDNTNLTKASRKKYLEIAEKYGKVVDLIHFSTNIEDCQIRVLHRQWQKFGKLFFTGTDKNIKDSHIFPPAALYKSRKNVEQPIRREGIRTITRIEVPSPISIFSNYTNKALFLDIDGTLRQTEHLTNKYPIKPEEVVPYTDIEKMKAKINSYRKDGYLLFGVSNQSGIHKGILTEADCKECMDRTKEILELNDMEIIWCSHQSAPIRCYCRKPQSGMGMYFIEKYKVDPGKSIMVGDLTSDKTFAERLGITYIDVKDFW